MRTGGVGVGVTRHVLVWACTDPNSTAVARVEGGAAKPALGKKQASELLLCHGWMDRTVKACSSVYGVTRICSAYAALKDCLREYL